MKNFPKEINTTNLNEDEVIELLMDYLSFQAFKTAIGNGKVNEQLPKTEIVKDQYRMVYSKFVGLPWIIKNLSKKDINILKQIHKELSF